MELVTSQAMKAGFYGGVVVDYPNSTKAKKYFLVLMTGGNMPLPKALGTGEDANGMQTSLHQKLSNKTHRLYFQYLTLSILISFIMLHNIILIKNGGHCFWKLIIKFKA